MKKSLNLNLFVLFIVAIVGIVTFFDMLASFKQTFIFSIVIWILLFGIDKHLVHEFV